MRSVFLACILAVGLAAAASPASATERSDDASPNVVSSARWLAPAEIAAADVTGAVQGRSLIRDVAGDGRGASPLRAYRFGSTTAVVSAAAKLTVLTGNDAEGETAYEVFPVAEGVAITVAAGFVTPPDSRFTYNNESQFTSTSGTWIRKVWWQIEKADNYTCSGCGTYDYWRIYGRIQGSTTSGASENHGYKRLWLEFDRTSGASAYEFEPVKPVESYKLQGNTTTTIGFGANAGVRLGGAPAEANGGLDLSYTGSITKSTENWHPVVRAESGSGGVQWCYYVNRGLLDNEFTGTRYLTTRASVRQASTASGPAWNVLYGMDDVYSNCPSQL